MNPHRSYCYFYLTCEDRQEADKITAALLEKRLIVCAKFLPVDCTYWWQGSIETGKEIMVIMESAEDLFQAVEAEVARLHSYDTFVLEAVPVTRTSSNAEHWMKENLAPILS